MCKNKLEGCGCIYTSLSLSLCFLVGLYKVGETAVTTDMEDYNQKSNLSVNGNRKVRKML